MGWKKIRGFCFRKYSKYFITFTFQITLFYVFVSSLVKWILFCWEYCTCSEVCCRLLKHYEVMFLVRWIRQDFHQRPQLIYLDPLAAQSLFLMEEIKLRRDLSSLQSSTTAPSAPGLKHTDSTSPSPDPSCARAVPAFRRHLVAKTAKSTSVRAVSRRITPWEWPETIGWFPYQSLLWTPWPR